MHGQGMQTAGEFSVQQPVNDALAGKGLQIGKAVTDHEQPEMGFALRWGTVLVGFVHQFQVQGGQFPGQEILDALSASHWNGLVFLGRGALFGARG